MKVSNKYSEPSVLEIYKKLYKYYGRQYWWPAESELEIMIGAILTQNTSWINVEKTIKNLKKKKLLNINKLSQISLSSLAREIHSAGFFRIKAKRLKSLINFLLDNYSGKISALKKERLVILRNELLDINGIGNETADSILLYALNKPVFVVDSYTRRIFSRHKFFDVHISYAGVQQFFTSNLPGSVKIYNEYHALLVRLAKDFCRKKPICDGCPLKGF